MPVLDIFYNLLKISALGFKKITKIDKKCTNLTNIISQGTDKFCLTWGV
jgi:hypothetical protein